MGSGAWDNDDFKKYSRNMGRTVRADGNVDTSRMKGAQDMYKARNLDKDLDPRGVIRECCDTQEHPKTGFGCDRIHGRITAQNGIRSGRYHERCTGKIQGR